ncbi:MAG: hypothetical protein AAGA20_10765 [Planctomycetota bacterium]
MSPIRISRLPRVLLVAAPLAPALAVPGVPQSMSEKAVESEIAFARGLARDWAFVDTAQDVLTNVASGNLSERMSTELDLVRCDIYGIGAKASTDAERRNALFEEAVEAYQSFLDANPYAEGADEAKSALVDLIGVYSISLDISLEDAVGEEADALRQRKFDILDKAKELGQELVTELEAVPDDEKTPQTQTKLWVAKLDLASTYAKMAGAAPDNPAWSEAAIDEFEGLLFDAGQGTEIGLRAYAGLGDVFAAMGQDGEARDYYSAVIDSVIPIDPQQREELLGWSDMPLDIKQKRFLYVELAVPGVMRTSRNLGESEAGIETGLFFYNLYRQEGFTLSSLGNTAMLEFAGTLVDAGGFIGGDLGAGEAQWFATEEEMREAVRARRLQRTSIEFALDLAKQIAEDNPGTEASRKGGELIATINERPGIEIPPAQLLQAADAKYRGQDYEAALAGYRELLRRLDTLEPADRVEFGAKVYNGLGLTLGRQDRDLESALAFREALLNWRDPEWDSSNARGYLAKIRSWARDSEATEDSEVAELIREAENFAIEFADGETTPDQIIFNRGEKERNNGNFAAAIAEYEKIGPTDGYYELAQTQIGVCKLYMKELLAAREVFDKYLTERVPDPAFEPTSPIEEARRRQCVARAEFYRGYIDHVIARSKFDKSEGADASGYQQVIEQLEGFASRHGDSGRIVVQARSILVDSYAKTDQAAKAAEVVEEMRREHPDNPATASASIDLYLALRQRRARLEEGGAEADAVAKVTREMANALKVANEISAQPDYSRLRNESKLWFELQEWEEAKRPLERLVDRFGDDPKRKDDVTKLIVPDLAEAMIELGDVTAAKDMLAPLVVGDDAPLRFQRPTILLSRAMLGSVTGTGSRVQNTPGAGGTEEEFAFITRRLDTFATSGQKWTSCDWYEAKFQSIYAYYVWGQQDDRKLATAKKVIDDVLVFLENDVQFSKVDEICSSDDEDPAIRRRLGDGVLSARYRWLYDRTR